MLAPRWQSTTLPRCPGASVMRWCKTKSTWTGKGSLLGPCDLQAGCPVVVGDARARQSWLRRYKPSAKEGMHSWPPPHPTPPHPTPIPQAHPPTPPLPICPLHHSPFLAVPDHAAATAACTASHKPLAPSSSGGRHGPVKSNSRAVVGLDCSWLGGICLWRLAHAVGCAAAREGARWRAHPRVSAATPPAAACAACRQASAGGAAGTRAGVGTRPGSCGS